MDVQLGQVIRAEEELTLCLSAHCLVDGQCLLFVLLDLFSVLSTRKDHSEEVRELLVELLHLEPHLGSLKWVRWNQLDPLVLSALHGPERDDSTVGDQVTLGCLEDRDGTPVGLHVPLSLFVEVDEALLELVPLC